MWTQSRSSDKTRNAVDCAALDHRRLRCQVLEHDLRGLIRTAFGVHGIPAATALPPTWKIALGTTVAVVVLLAVLTSRVPTFIIGVFLAILSLISLLMSAMLGAVSSGGVLRDLLAQRLSKTQRAE